ncbi:MAG: hypothetical protein DRO12_05070 [Thermoprotei archaeon]|nr:MAG: hypothetical protein DRO12_05070 [Thermoprotei archaeon]
MRILWRVLVVLLIPTALLYFLVQFTRMWRDLRMRIVAVYEENEEVVVEPLEIPYWSTLTESIPLFLRVYWRDVVCP